MNICVRTILEKPEGLLEELGEFVWESAGEARAILEGPPPPLDALAPPCDEEGRPAAAEGGGCEFAEDAILARICSWLEIACCAWCGEKDEGLWGDWFW
jgi:hypothetical protein